MKKISKEEQEEALKKAQEYWKNAPKLDPEAARRLQERWRSEGPMGIPAEE